MNFYVFEKAGDIKLPGSWKPVVNGSVSQFKAILICPECHKPFDLRNHTVNENGEVKPSVVCPNKECTFHQFVKLNDWKRHDSIA